MDSTPLPVMTESGRVIHWQGRMYKLLKNRTAEAYSDAHRARRKAYMRAYRAKKRATVEISTRAEDIPIVTSVTTL